TDLSPCLSVARAAQKLVFSVFEKNNYNLYAIETPEGLAGSPLSTPVAGVDAGKLPPMDRLSARLGGRQTFSLADVSRFRVANYRAGLSLDYVDQPSIGAGVSNRGIGVGGGAALYWSDMLGNHQMATLFQVTGEQGNVVNNVGALIGYANLKSRLHWGGEVGQIPIVTSRFTTGTGTLNGEPVIVEQEERQYQINRELLGEVAYPFSQVQRVEMGLR